MKFQGKLQQGLLRRSETTTRSKRTNIAGGRQANLFKGTVQECCREARCKGTEVKPDQGEAGLRWAMTAR
jgi:hypothetical protein